MAVMANFGGKNKLKTKQFSHDIFFDGALLSNTRASLVVELIKYFLYERQQIPLPVDELREKIAQEEEHSNLRVINNNDFTDQDVFHLKHKSHHVPEYESKTQARSFDFCKSSVNSDFPLSDLTNIDASHATNHDDLKFYPDHNHRQNAVYSVINGTGNRHHAMSKAPASKHVQDKKGKVLIREITQLFESLQKAFELCPEIEQVAVILGGTVMNPKESYLITFPPPSPEADSIPLLSCKRTLFQQIISEDMLGTMSANITPTSLMVLISAPRSCPLEGFLPKHFLRSPRTGSVISFNFHCNYLIPVCYDLTIGDGDFELSGLDPFDLHGKDRSVLGDLVVHGKNETALSENIKVPQGWECGTNQRKVQDKENFEEEIQNGDFLIQCELSSLKISADKGNLYCLGGNDIQKIRQNDKFLNMKTESPIVDGGSPRTDQIDCIWYQSPFVIKGYSIRDPSHNRFLNS